MNRIQIADNIMHRLELLHDDMYKQWQSSGPIHYMIVEDLLPDDVARQIRAAFPEGSQMRTRKNLRELKHVAAQMNQYDQLLEEALFAFQDPRLVALIERITGLRGLEPDEKLYAGGISMMSKDHFLNPHIDNSHDKDRERYRVLNLLYYVSPGWELSDGGNLELWPKGVTGPQTTIQSKFNRLAIMVTNKVSWHSVAPVKADSLRCCVSNYYFSKFPADASEYFHVTSFRARPEQPIRDLLLQADSALRMGVRKLFPKGAIQTTHFYDKSKDEIK
jgi:Rps23 Pro-64 3,4-dihydroxylase Tpa1-like proline 4-hydroxylase